MHPTSAFAAPFGFVVWTIPSPARGACHLVSTPSLLRELGSGSPCLYDKGFPEFDRLYTGVYTPGSPMQRIISNVESDYESRKQLHGVRTHSQWKEDTFLFLEMQEHAPSELRSTASQRPCEKARACRSRGRAMYDVRIQPQPGSSRLSPH